MTKVINFAAERRFLDRVAGELHNARLAGDYDAIKEAHEDLEIIAMHTDVVVLRERANKLMKLAFDPLPKRPYPY